MTKTTKQTLVDSHCHLNFPQFMDNLEVIVERAEAAGVGIMQTICTKISEFPDVLAIAEKYDNIYASVGIHPHEAENEQISTDELVKLTQHPKVIGIGETGLDYYYEHSPRERQQESFRIHIAAARQTGLPLIVHTREAEGDTIDILYEEMQRGKFTGLIHCFSSSQYLAEKSIDMGLYISLSGIITFKKSDELREIAKNLPLERLLVETDAPFLAPVPHRGKTNEPAFTRYVAELLAELKDISYEEVANATTANFLNLFQKIKQLN